MVVKAGMATIATLEWSFPVLNATKKHREPKFFVDYHIWNQKMKADRSSLSKVQTLFNKLADGVVFTTLDFFSRYWQL